MNKDKGLNIIRDYNRYGWTFFNVDWDVMKVELFEDLGQKWFNILQSWEDLNEDVYYIIADIYDVSTKIYINIDDIDKPVIGYLEEITNESLLTLKDLNE